MRDRSLPLGKRVVERAVRTAYRRARGLPVPDRRGWVLVERTTEGETRVPTHLGETITLRVRAQSQDGSWSSTQRVKYQPKPLVEPAAVTTPEGAVQVEWTYEPGPPPEVEVYKLDPTWPGADPRA